MEKALSGFLSTSSRQGEIRFICFKMLFPTRTLVGDVMLFE